MVQIGAKKMSAQHFRMPGFTADFSLTEHTEHFRGSAKEVKPIRVQGALRSVKYCSVMGFLAGVALLTGNIPAAAVAGFFLGEGCIE
jgi:hypothetical protein